MSLSVSPSGFGLPVDLQSPAPPIVLLLSSEVLGLEVSATAVWSHQQIHLVHFPPSKVRIQRHRITFSRGTLFRRIRQTVSVDNQLSISLALAASNSFRSCGFKLEILTSLRCLFAAGTRKVISSGQVSSFQWSASLWLMFTSNLNT